MNCKFSKAWIGPCNNEVAEEATFCPSHESLKCHGCEGKATQECDHTGGLVCGCPICDDCMHHPPGMDDPNFMFMGGGHKPKSIAEPAWEKHWEEFATRMDALRKEKPT